MRPRPTSGERGFTLVELLMAAFVLLVGMAATVGVLAQGMSKTTLNSQRVAATNLARELVEGARAATYVNLTPAFVASAVQTAGGDLGSGSPWTVDRRNTTYTVSATACTFDDPADKVAATPPDDRCDPGPPAGSVTGDSNGDDFRRVTFDVSWKLNARSHTVRQSALIVNPSGGLGPRILPPFPTSPSPITTITGATSWTFGIRTTTAAAVHWQADDGVSSGDAVGGPTAWTATWALNDANDRTGAVLDGTYTIGAQPADERNVAGDTKFLSVTLNRRQPFAPLNAAGGHDTRDGDWIDFQWDLLKERDILGYRVYWTGPDNTVGGGDDQRVCPSPASSDSWLSNATFTCQATTPPPGAAKYYLVGVDYDNGAVPAVREGDQAPISVKAPTASPAPPGSLGVSPYSPPTLSWTPPASGSVAYYRVYRDGTTPAHRIGLLPGTATSFADDAGDDGTPHSYWLTAVDDTFNESALVGPVDWAG